MNRAPQNVYLWGALFLIFSDRMSLIDISIMDLVEKSEQKCSFYLNGPIFLNGSSSEGYVMFFIL